MTSRYFIGSLALSIHAHKSVCLLLLQPVQLLFCSCACEFCLHIAICVGSFSFFFDPIADLWNILMIKITSILIGTTSYSFVDVTDIRVSIIMPNNEIIFDNFCFFVLSSIHLFVNLSCLFLAIFFCHMFSAKLLSMMIKCDMYRITSRSYYLLLTVIVDDVIKRVV